MDQKSPASPPMFASLARGSAFSAKYLRATSSRLPVRARSFEAGRCEGLLWKPIERRSARRIVIAAKIFERSNRRFGRRSGPLGHVALEVIELLVNLVDRRSGRLEPSIEWLQVKLRRSRDAVVRALKALRDHGFVSWLRRYVPTGAVSGPRIRQTSNAYALHLPALAAALLHRNPPAPVDDEHRRQLDAARLDEWRSEMALDERALFDVGDTPLGRSLARFARAVSERESARRSEIKPGSI